jgi:hypothetical protein
MPSGHRKPYCPPFFVAGSTKPVLMKTQLVAEQGQTLYRDLSLSRHLKRSSCLEIEAGRKSASNSTSNGLVLYQGERIS